MDTKIHLPGKNAYENQLLKHHRREVKRFLINERIYTPHQIAVIMRFYDKQISIKNILMVHTHATLKFLTALCSDELETLYNNTTCKSFTETKQG